jgi:hypothetical protein
VESGALQKEGFCDLHSLLSIATTVKWISERVAGWTIRDWVEREHQKHWQSTSGQKHAKCFLDKPSTKRTTELLKVSRVQIRQVTGLLTGHCLLRGHIFKLWKVNNPICRRCYLQTETASHVLCECEALAETRFRYLGRHFLKPGNYHEISLSRTVLCCRYGATGGLEERGGTKDQQQLHCKGCLSAHPIYIHT